MAAHKVYFFIYCNFATYIVCAGFVQGFESAISSKDKPQVHNAQLAVYLPAKYPAKAKTDDMESLPGVGLREHWRGPKQGLNIASKPSNSETTLQRPCSSSWISLGMICNIYIYIYIHSIFMQDSYMQVKALSVIPSDHLLQVVVAVKWKFKFLRTWSAHVGPDIAQIGWLLKYDSMTSNDYRKDTKGGYERAVVRPHLTYLTSNTYNVKLQFVAFQLLHQLPGQQAVPQVLRRPGCIHDPGLVVHKVFPQIIAIEFIPVQSSTWTIAGQAKCNHEWSTMSCNMFYINI